MKNFYKVLAITALVAAAVFSFAACGKGKTGGSTQDAGTTKGGGSQDSGTTAGGGASTGGAGGGMTWTLIEDSTFDRRNDIIFAITYGGGKFVAGGSIGKMAYSSDCVK